jgi:hypothetical protein
MVRILRRKLDLYAEKAHMRNGQADVTVSRRFLKHNVTVGL